MRKLSEKQKKIRGTYKGSRHKEPPAPVQFGRLTSIPKPPDWLSDVGKEVFTELASILYEVGILQRSDLHMLAQLSAEISRYREAYAHLQSEGQVITLSNGYPKASQYVRIAEKAFSGANELAGKFGLDLSGRMKIPEMAKPPRIEYDDFLTAHDDHFWELHFGHLDNISLNNLANDIFDYVERREKKGIDTDYQKERKVELERKMEVHAKK